MFEGIIRNAMQAVKQPENTYTGDDGLLHCSVCHRAVQVKVVLFDEERIAPCICDCRIKELEAEEQLKKQEENDRKRRICFAETNMMTWTFANDDGKDPKLSAAMKNYVKNFAEFRKDGMGLLLSGTVGTGKTYLAACIANAVIDNGYTALMTNFARLSNQIQEKFEGRQKYIDSLNNYSLLILDDLGAERKSEYMLEMVFNIIDSRYRAGLPFIVTTNLSLDEIKKPQSIEYSRIYDRILERCHPIEVNGISRRRQNVKASYFDMKEKLGL